MLHQLSDYEQKRLDNIEKNKELLRQLNVPAVGSNQGLPKAKSKERQSAIKHNPKRVKKEKPLPSRASARLRGVAADAENDDSAVTLTAEELLERAEAKKPKRIHKLMDQDQADFLKILEDVKADNVIIPNIGPPSDKVPKSLQKEASNLKLRHIWPTIKVTPDRINYAAFHPSSNKLLACAGDINGHLGFWDVNGQKEDPEEDGPQPIVYTYRPHTQSMSCMMFNPANPSQLYTSSYDGTIQYFDMEKAEFTTAFEDKDEKIPFTAFDMPKEGHSIWFSTSNGEIGHHDFRTPNSEHSMYAIREKKVGCIAMNPENQTHLACSSNDRTVTIWDIRQIRRKPKPILQFQHGYSVASCFWSPNGKKLLTTSYDNRIRIISTPEQMTDLEEEFAIEHNNRTGKWVTLFRARWNYNVNARSHPHFCVASMKHPVEVFSGETAERICELYDPDKITAVPAVSLFHPTTASMTILCGNGSGRMVCWT